MPSISKIIRRFTRQYMLYWQRTGSDESGQPAFVEPVEVKCRWEDRDQEVLTVDGRKVVAHGYILVNQPVIVGSLVLQGGTQPGSAFLVWKALPTYPAIPTVNQGGREILKINATPDLAARGSVHEVFI